MTSCYGGIVQSACAPLHNHVGELGHFDFSVVSFLYQVHDGERCAHRHRAPSLPVAEVAFRLLAAPRAPESLVPGGFNDPVLGPSERPEVDEVLLPAAGVFALVYIAVPTRAVEGTK